MAAIYVVNWWLANSSVDYFADGGVISPVNHFWSLSVEEQFYLVWPVLIRIVWRWANRNPPGRLNVDFSRLVVVLLVAIFVLSLAAAISATDHNRASAYFFTHTRAWEFAIGGLAGVWVRLGYTLGSQRMRSFLLPGCWSILIISGWAYGPSSRVPGFSVVPVVFASAVLLVIGDSYRSRFANRLIRLQPVQWVGDSSYSIYLWHWPMLVFAPFVMKTEHLSFWQSLAVLGALLVVSALSYRYVEISFQKRSSANQVRKRYAGTWVQLSGFVLISIVIAGSIGKTAHFMENKTALIAQELFVLSRNPSQCFGARATEEGADCPESHTLKNELYALQNWDTQVLAFTNGWVLQNELGNSEIAPVSFGAAEDTAKRHIALLGDSHAGMWATALNMFVVENEIRVTSYLASGCPATDDPLSYAFYLSEVDREACLVWRGAAAQAIIADLEIDTVVVSGAVYSHKSLKPPGWAEDDGSGFAALWSRFIAAGKKVVVVDDVPMLPFKPPECLSQPHPRQDRCSHPVSDVPVTTPMGRAVDLMKPGTVDYISLKDVFCDDTTCHSIIGGIPAYMDRDHISAPLARSLASRIEQLVVARD